jgi:hypothetical protein
MRPDDAYAVFVQDCVDGQQRDQMQGDQQDRDDDSADSNEEEQ